MATDIRNFDASFLLPLVLTEIKDINQPTSQIYSLDQYVDLVRKYNVFTLCDSSLALSTTERELEKCVYNIKASTIDYTSLLNNLRNLQTRLLNENGYWIEVFFPITSMIIYYLYRNWSTKDSERDKNLDVLSSRQVLKMIGAELEVLLKGEQARFCKAMRPKIKTGRIAIPEEFIFAYKYYYIDLDGKRHSQYNSEKERDSAVDKYLAKCYLNSCDSSNSLSYTSNLIVKRLVDVNVYAI
ncbi:MAG TPA: hypothetical protein OIM59_05625 [Bacteroides mediterraneensis]|uniref:hypothetical protein n=1 Tax=Bacteroides mediterraneensis TaxID=1841856 RepID=UPI0026EF0D90|nr:hypothetical protein [Bacteroides mediterraneensis]HJH64108.1 hypothetical protein [Bacteroides mediterraneensis]